MFFENLPELGKNGNNVQFGDKVTILWNVWSMEGGGSLYMCMFQNVM